MHTYAMLKTGQPLTIDVDWSIGNPERVSLKKKLAFLRAERRKRQEGARVRCAYGIMFGI